MPCDCPAGIAAARERDPRATLSTGVQQCRYQLSRKNRPPPSRPPWRIRRRAAAQNGARTRFGRGARVWSGRRVEPPLGARPVGARGAPKRPCRPVPLRRFALLRVDPAAPRGLGALLQLAVEFEIDLLVKEAQQP